MCLQAGMACPRFGYKSHQTLALVDNCIVAIFLRPSLSTGLREALPRREEMCGECVTALQESARSALVTELQG